ncbi:HMG-box domain-containing protein [endosymbiont GvMRE of Glomus versiforme]|uniref:HMG-box domain-containing protein n=1 Tax=endosymbiont GvMRE of Glomus versiforme TaxID=2039283 RepID=UPI00155940F3|nr:HMG-box domain-containing protein [endosymbiont GvMRE of Glomus versiforme]
MQKEKKNHIPRPPNAFILYRKDKAALFRDLLEVRLITNQQISKEIAKLWRNESFEVKERYKKLAKSFDEEHKKNNPSYKYSPQKKNKQKVKNLKTLPPTFSTHVENIPYSPLASTSHNFDVVQSDNDGFISFPYIDFLPSISTKEISQDSNCEVNDESFLFELEKLQKFF